jgi:GYF domain 2
MSARWFLARDKKKLGPYTQEQLKKLASAGHVQGIDRLQQEGASAWVPAHKLAWLAAALAGPAETPAEDEAEAAPARRSKKEGKCYRCEESGPGKVYPFYCGFKVRESRSHDWRTGMTHVYKRYRDVTGHSIFLCRDCAVALWRARYLKSGLPWLFGLVVVGIGLVVALPYLEGEARIPVLIIAGIFGLLLGILAVDSLYRAAVPSLKREVLNEFVLDLVRKDYKDRELGDTFFTPEEFDEMNRK